LKTKYTRTGERDMTNRKPYRTAAQKAEARANAVLPNGTHVSSTPVTFHRAPKRGAA